MTNITKDTKNITKEENEAQKEEAEARRVSLRLQEILEEEGYAIQPFINPNVMFGIIPGVRLVKNPQSEDKGTGEKTGGGS